MDHTYSAIDFTLQVLTNYGIPVNTIKHPFDQIESLDLGLRFRILKYERNTDHAKNRILSLEKDKIYLFTDLFACNYIVFYYPDQQTVASIGPFLFEQMNKEKFIELLNRLSIPSAYDSLLYEYYSSITYIPTQTFLETLILQMGKTLYGESCRIIYLDSDMHDFQKLQKQNLLRLPDEKSSHIDFLSMRCKLENNLISAISSGNLKLALKLNTEANDFLSLSQPRLSNKLRDYKNHAISFIAMVRKSLELKGIHPIYTDAIASTFVSEVEQCANIEELQILIKKIVTAFCNIANEYQHKTHSSLIDTILTYVDIDLCSNLTLNTFAKNLNVNASYLSALFSREMGMTLTDYVTMKRIERAKYLLGLTECSIKSVAEQCGYSDIYYFSRIFKRETGISPKEFHDSFYKEDHDIIKNLTK